MCSKTAIAVRVTKGEFAQHEDLGWAFGIERGISVLAVQHCHLNMGSGREG